MGGRHRIAIDATVVSRRLKGTGRVVKNLLATLPQVDGEGEYLALTTSEGADVLRDVPGIQIRTVRPTSGLRWELFGLGREAAKVGADLVLTLREIVGFGGPPTVMHIAEPPAYRLGARGQSRPLKWIAKDYLLQALLSGSIRRAALVTAGSETTARWLKDRYGIDPPVIYPGIDPIFLTDDGPKTAGQPYFLHPATGDPRDNTELVLAGFSRAKLDGVRLVAVGAKEEEATRIRRRATELGIADSVQVLGWVSDEELRDLYRGALALVHPTRYECFAGLQPLEAMALGTPVIALDAPGASEALSDAALLLAGEEVDLMASALDRIATDPRTREALGETGRERAKQLRWESSAQRFIDQFSRVLTA